MPEFSFPNSSSTPHSNTSQPGSDNTPTPGQVNPDAAVHPSPLTDRVAQTAHHTIDRLAESASPHIERMESAVTQATHQLKNQAQHVREKGDEWANDLRATVRRNPLTAVAVAMAAGALIVRLKR